VETLLDVVGRTHTRAWVAYLVLLLNFATVAGIYTTLRLTEGHVLPVTLWMALQQISGTITSLSFAFIGPMIYEYISRSQMGTINAGRGIYSGIVGFLVPNLGAWWVVFYTANVGNAGSGSHDYTSLYILQLVLFLPSIAVYTWFIRRVAAGKVPRTGVLEVEAEFERGK
jgi:hypothetical protein